MKFGSGKIRNQWDYVRLRAWVLAILMCGQVVPVFAQVTIADVLGAVLDVVPGAVAKLKSKNTHETPAFVTAKDNRTALQPGDHVVTITAPGFEAFQGVASHVLAGDRVRIDARLRTGVTAEEAAITTSASALRTDSSTVASTVSQAAVQDIPLNGRKFLTLVQVAPG